MELTEGRFPAYRATARRLRVWLTVPIIIAVGVAAWAALGASKSYESQATLWVDNAAPLGSSLDPANLATTAPSTQEQTLLDEMLDTPSFVEAVGASSGLRSYLALHPSSSGWGPSALLSRLKSGGSVNTRVESALGSGVGTFIAGPQVLQLSFTGPTATIATSTVAALVRQLEAATTRYGQEYAQNEASYDRTQVTAATQALTAAREQVAAYQQDHPGVTAANNANYASLLAAQTAATNQLTQVSSSLRDAEAQAQSNTATGVTVRLVDPASAAIKVGGGKKAAVTAVVGGLFAGLILDILAVVLLTPGGLGKWEPEESGEMDPLPRLGAVAQKRGNPASSTVAAVRIARSEPLAVQPEKTGPPARSTVARGSRRDSSS